MAKKLVPALHGGKPTTRPQRPGGWTQAKRNIFLAELAQTANVKASAAAAGMADQGAYKLRQRDPAFARAWQEALSEAYAKLETILLERALNGAAGDVVVAGDGSRIAQLSERTLMQMLQQHRVTVREYRAERASEAGRDLVAEESAAREALIARLTEMQARLRGDGA
jgi:hypothetical protein